MKANRRLKLNENQKPKMRSLVEKLTVKGLFTFSLWVCLGFFSALSAASEKKTNDALTHEFTLNNGLRLIVREDHRSPTVAHMAWYKAGSIDEKNGTTGVAHVLEHMMFKGTTKLGPGEFSKQVAKLGGRENAFTSSEYTAYFQQVEKTHLEKIMSLEADRMQNLVLSEEEFKKEIQVVMEERRLRTEDQALGLLYEQFNATAFNASPKRHPVIGWMSDLQTMTYLDAQQWYQQWYSPKNAVVVIAGDVHPREVLAIAEKTYGKVPPKEIAERKLQTEPAQRGIRRFSLKAPAENTVMYMGWRVPTLKPANFSEREPYALDVLSGILDGNPNARLNRILVRDKKIATSAGAWYDSCCSRSEELFLINVGLSGKKNTDQIEKEIRSIIRDIAEKGVKEEELNRVKIAVTAAQIYKRDSVFGQAMEIGGMEMTGMSWRQIDEWTKNLQTVTAQEVQQVAKKYLIDDSLTIGVLDPQPIDPKTAAANARAASGLKH